MTPTLLRVATIAQVLAALPVDPASWLSLSEQARLQRLSIASRRHQYLSGHWLARCLLAEQRGGRPEDWPLEERPSLPPAVAGLGDELHLSLSHSGDWIAAAVSAAPIGIDIEQRQPARSALHRFEHLLLAEGEHANTLSTDQLLQRWVAKEAWVKQHHGSALPEYLAKLKLRQSTPGSGNVRVDSLPSFHLGVASAKPASVNAQLPAAVLASQCWRVSEPADAAGEQQQRVADNP